MTVSCTEAGAKTPVRCHWVRTNLACIRQGPLPSLTAHVNVCETAICACHQHKLAENTRWRSKERCPSTRFPPKVDLGAFSAKS